jgi:hypothetical protein
MTALAFALVACCAMVCGTRLVLRGYDIREVEAEAAMKHYGGVTQDIADLGSRVNGLGAEVTLLRQQAESLRADMAVRSIA